MALRLDNGEPQKRNRPSRAKRLDCRDCNVTIVNQRNFNRHLLSREHRQHQLTNRAGREQELRELLTNRHVIRCDAL